MPAAQPGGRVLWRLERELLRGHEFVREEPGAGEVRWKKRVGPTGEVEEGLGFDLVNR